MTSRQFKKFNFGVSASGGIESIPSPTASEEEQKKSVEPPEKVSSLILHGVKTPFCHNPGGERKKSYNHPPRQKHPH